MAIWYDVSGLYSWGGSFTGIQRAVFNIGQSLSIDDPASRFFIFQHGDFCEISFSKLEERLLELRQVNVDGPNAGTPLSIAKLQHYGMVAAKQAVIGSPLERLLRQAYGGLRVARRGFKPHQRVLVTTKGSTASIFGSDDVVVIVDGNWQFSGYAKNIVSAKKRHGFKLVHFVHDIVAIQNPALANTGADKIIGTYFEAIFPHSDKLLAISESTKRDVEHFAKEHGVKVPDVSVVLLGSDMQQGAALQAKRPSAIASETRFALAVSTLEIRKNYMLLYYTYKQAARDGTDLPHLIIVGRKGWMTNETFNLLTKDPEVCRSVTILSGMADEELEWLYQNCLFTVFPSMYEGWGLPIAESLMHGKCCISSDTSSMPEVGGDLVSYVSPYSAIEVVHAMQVLSNDKVRKELESRVKKDYKPVTWTHTYESFKTKLSQLSA